MEQSQLIKQHILNQHKKHKLNRPFIIAIDGLSGAGKTTIVNHLKNMLDNILVIHIDDHIVERKKRYNTGHEQWYEYYQLQWDTVYLEEELYKKLYQNKDQLHLSFYNKDHDSYVNKTIPLSPYQIVIIEGVFLLREEWKNYYDYIIFLDCPKEIRYERVLVRDAYIGDKEQIVDKYQNRYWVAEEHYLNKQSPLTIAHCIVKSDERSMSLNGEKVDYY